METLLVVIFGVIFYFLPTIVAANRKHHSTPAIFMLNLLLGWSGLFWLIALVWACTVVRSKQYALPVAPDAQ